MSLNLDSLLRIRKVMDLTGLPYSTLYRKIADGEFPRPVAIGQNAVAWRAKEVLDWIKTRPERPKRPARKGKAA